MRPMLGATGLILFGLGLLTVAAWQYFGTHDSPGLIVDEPEREIAGCSVGQSRVHTFLFHNRSHHPVRIVGMSLC